MRDILIVEDGRKERERLAALFEKAGYAVVPTESVSEAETVLREEPFRLVILDIGLGDRSGTHLFQFIRRIHPDTRIIVFTGNPSVHLKDRFLNKGATDYIVKGSPESSDKKFLNRIQEMLPLSTDAEKLSGIPLDRFLKLYINEKSRKLFSDIDDQIAPCAKCQGKDFIVSFEHQLQMPPEVIGKVLCASCGSEMDPEIQ